MNPRAQIRMLPDRRLHMHDGPIDLIVEAFGEKVEVERAYRTAAARFVTVLDELCSELTFLRQPARLDSPLPNGPVARRMLQAVLPFAKGVGNCVWEGHEFTRAARRRQRRGAFAPGGTSQRLQFNSGHFITPMAAVAGAVAEEILLAMTSAARLTRAYVNNGGDIALHLTPGQSFVVGMVERPDRPSLLGTTTIQFEHPIRGIATSGWRGRSFSLGIADAVTVLADTAPAADAAATIIANAVDLPGHPAITRARACDLAPDSDLGERLVTQAVGELSRDEIREALAAGLQTAEALRQIRLIHAAALSLQGSVLASNQETPLSFMEHVAC